MYVCGPTVYSFAHIGNARPCVVFDVLARLLRRSHRLVYVRNVTDVDDKINEAARAEGVPIEALTERYLAAYHEDMESLGVLPPDVEPKATGHIAEIIDLVERLIESGHAYATEGHVLFSVPSFDDYGALSGRSQQELIAGARVKVASYKRNPADFVLWKPSDAEGVGWDSPWGYGRPGWHAECSAMVRAHLGETIDIHGGGLDLVFPHHENETAQSTCAYGARRYCRHWVHNGLVDVRGEKMSKSLGNVLLVRDLLEEAPGEAVRLGLLTAHYRQPLDWTSGVLEDARDKLDKMYGALRNAGVTGPAASGEVTEQSAVIPATGQRGVKATVDRRADDPSADHLAAKPAGHPAAAELAADPPGGVLAALEDDLNTPKALAELFAVVRRLNRAADPETRAGLARELRAGGWLLGLLQGDPQAWFTDDRGADDPGDEWIDAKVEERQAMRRARNFAEADRIRDELESLGILVEDRADGPRWRWARN